MKNENIVIAKDVIDLQIKALKQLKNFLDKSFDKAVKKIAKCQSKVIICGVGKSGIIASKISATLSSIGTPSFTVSANDCSHGDLGRITKKDILILISNSGKSFMDLPAGSVIGTSSIRRRSQVLSLRKDLSIKLLRGNVDTRIQKLRNNEYDAVILSLAGLSRLNLDHLVTEVLEHNLFLPAACQGAVGVQALKSSEVKKILAPINDPQTQTECMAERRVLKNINANCNSPVSIYANINKNNITIQFEIFDHHGNKILKKSKEDLKENCVKLCDELSEEIINTVGQTKINELDNLKSDFDYTPS